jgi:hypothetical protein
METKTMHRMRPEEQMVNLSRMSLANVNQIEQYLTEPIKAGITAQFPTIFDDAYDLIEKFKDYDRSVGVEFTDDELYTLYICLDLMGRIFTSSYWDVLFDSMPKHEGLGDAGAQLLIQDFALPNIDNFFKRTEMYAEQTNNLKELPAIKERLRRLPMFD